MRPSNRLDSSHRYPRSLFTRARIVALTPLGEAFLPYARRALEVDQTVRATDHESLLGLLGDGIVDLSFVVWPVAPPAADTLAPLFVFRESVVLVAHPGHPLARQRTVSPDDVAMLSRPLVRLRWWRQHNPLVTELADRSGTATDLPMEVARHLILSGIGTGFFARTYVRTDLAGGVLVEIPVRGMASLHRDVALVRRRGTSLSPAAAALVQALWAQAGRIGLAPKPPPKAARRPAKAALGDERR